MERLPTIKHEEVEQKEREVSPEKRSRMWETLRMVGLAGLLTFGGAQAGKEAAEVLNSMKIQEVHSLLPKEKDGKLVDVFEIKTADGTVYSGEVETDLPYDKYKSGGGGAGGGDWNTSYLHTTAEDGSGTAIRVDVTLMGLKVSTQELASGGKVLNERTSWVKEEPKSFVQESQEK
ncbi:MAG: hypothetical protein A2750_02730 [Candidatus Yanofskybacteria bacterium RIFCSPHIGHO2_01_FULL_45_42]|uniref:Uncharacterized protein n=2 Tax=Candidatus Yanofskyibacteriota TaxID=1752733 RepID=A0A1F8FPE2_9BACT|nr:MAG: hypothetical protein A2750_02730 [Candidatus Yanofskybacteria bacterium RIFCSPHIGHO2_01_FULL_45_42]OGN14881.1 MAG: hypothetical protein A3J47_02675 [Candidatus Yanofskybacteria bacterium RIFCSPHIGHO2_02_FULL_43_22]